MEFTQSIKELLNEDPVLKRICQSQHFMMRQTSDIINENSFDHVTFVGTEPIKSILSKEYGLEKEKNTIMVDSYVQLFVSEEVFGENPEVFNNERNGVNYSVISHYDEVFKGFVMNKEFFILLNGDNFDHRYGVYVLIDGSTGNKFICNNSNKNITFFGFINIGYLIDPAGYTEDQLLTFESQVGYSIPPLIRGRLENTSIIDYKPSKKLFHVDLLNYNNPVKNKFTHATKNLTNSKFIKGMISEDKEESDRIEEENNTFVKSMKDGFLYLGIINKITVEMESTDNIDSRVDELYLLMNYDEHVGYDFSFTVWQYTILNNNAKKVLDLYVQENQDKTLDEIMNEEKNYNMYDNKQIMHSMKYLTNM